MPDEPLSDRSGELIAQRYKLLAPLDRGGQGVVYRALDMRHGDEVAVKILRDTSARDIAFRERMLREAHALTVLRGTAAVRVLHQAWAEDGSFCLITELLQGKDLEAYLHDIEQSGRRIGLGELIDLLEPVVATLEVAHTAGIIHRDLKPPNVFVLNDGGVRLLDFGFAKFLRMRSVTQAGLVAGSPSYIAPELWRGETNVDHRLDVYSLGALAYRALSGVPPFSGEGLKEILHRVTTAPRPSLYKLRPDLPRSVDDWVRQALASDPEERFSRVRAMWNALSAVRTKSELPPDEVPHSVESESLDWDE
jgi:serine/threonine-protein kinase